MELFAYSLWLQPEGNIYQRFAKLIKKLAKEYDGPVFEPHVTLLGTLKETKEQVIVEKLKTLAKIHKPFWIRLGEITYQDYYFRTLFVKVQKTRELLALSDDTKEVFSMQDEPSYMPHLSLLYGTFKNDVKERIIAQIGQDQSASFLVKNIQIIHSSGHEHTWTLVRTVPLSF